MLSMTLDELDPGGPRTLEEMAARAKARKKAWATRRDAVEDAIFQQITDEAIAELKPPVLMTEAISQQMSVAQKFLDEALGISPRRILKVVSDFYQLPIPNLMSLRRTRIFVKPRHIAMYLIYEMTNISYPQVARYLGRIDHTTAIYAVDKIKTMLKTDPLLAAEIAEIKAALGV